MPSPMLIDMRNDPVCLDASYLIALLDARDSRHSDATRVAAVLFEQGIQTIAPDCVINESLTVFARRCRERREPDAFARLADRLAEAIPEETITWLYPHVSRWFTDCVTMMRGVRGAISFHDALLRVAADEVGYQAIVSFDAGLDRLDGLRRLGSAHAVKAWVRATREG
jgi:predicted nucleic acid-binding protein